MVSTPRAAPRPSGIRRLNEPRPTEVQADSSGLPIAVGAHGRRWIGVASIEDRWRIDDEWWRDQPVSRTFYGVVLQDGQRITLFRDELKLTWFCIRA